MYNFSFTRRTSKIDKKGFAPIEISIIINGKRTNISLPMKLEPIKFYKMMASKRNNEVLEYTSSIRTKLNKCIAEMTANNIAITAQSLKEGSPVKSGGLCKSLYLFTSFYPTTQKFCSILLLIFPSMLKHYIRYVLHNQQSCYEYH